MMGQMLGFYTIAACKRAAVKSSHSYQTLLQFSINDAKNGVIP